MKKLIQRIVDFRAGLTPEERDLFAQLAQGQRPEVLFVACSDSRVVPNLFASKNPGDLFALRNIGNLIPPSCSTQEDNSASAVIEFAVFCLNVSDIIICGHSECGAMQALTQGIDTHSCSHLACWLKHGEESLKKVRDGFVLDRSMSEHNQVSQVNVLQQMEHIATYSFVKERMEKKQLRVHGWWFDIAKAEVYYYKPEAGKFILIDEKEAAFMIEKLKGS